MLALTLLALVNAEAVIDDGGSQCPTGAAVAEAFRAVAGENASLREKVELRQIAAGIRLRLVDANGAALAERTLPGATDAEGCAELARAAAVVLAAWRTEVEATLPRLEIKPPPRVPNRRGRSAPALSPRWRGDRSPPAERSTRPSGCVAGCCGSTPS